MNQNQYLPEETFFGRDSSTIKAGDWALIVEDKIVRLFDNEDQANDWLDAYAGNETYELAYIS